MDVIGFYSSEDSVDTHQKPSIAISKKSLTVTTYKVLRAISRQFSQLVKCDLQIE